jgi:pimeloyl-ACP methyl ester carboxylesterase
VQQTVQLSVRKEGAHRADWDVAHYVAGSSSDLGSSNILLLVHGFANSPKKAHASYEKFIARLSAEDESFPGTWGAVCEFHWPGDYSGHPVLSALSYSARVPVAIGSGQRLAQFLHEDELLTEKKNLYIVAHSLGCRVALEALNEIGRFKEYKGPVVRAVALLAAAVPVEYCLPDTGEYKRMSSMDQHVFFSRHDMVLFGPFGPGQFFFGERGHAVGRNGGPGERWQGTTDTKLGHGDYWEDRHKVAPGVGQILSGGPVKPPERHLPETQPVAAEPPSSRTMDERETGSRG